jgi:hypothetical protein
MESQEQLDPNNGRIMHLKSNLMEEVQTSDSLLASILDGGNYSEDKVNSLSMKEERSWMFLEDMIMRTRISKSTTSMVELTSNGK